VGGDSHKLRIELSLVAAKLNLTKHLLIKIIFEIF